MAPTVRAWTTAVTSTFNSNRTTATSSKAATAFFVGINHLRIFSTAWKLLLSLVLLELLALWIQTNRETGVVSFTFTAEFLAGLDTLGQHFSALICRGYVGRKDGPFKKTESVFVFGPVEPDFLSDAILNNLQQPTHPDES